ncbi:hypothetical protein C0995_002279 [Termitomyces sp. Mi166|nr:hypothetical protein C0995_002279 [Termitomyces sp. Mi166\
MMQYQTINPDWMGRNVNAARKVEQAPSVPPAGSNQEKSGQKPPRRHKSLTGVLVEEPDQESSNKEKDGRSRSTLSVQLRLVLDRFPMVTKELMQKHLQLYVVKHMQLLANRGQNVPMADSTEYIKLFTRIFELELNEYIKCKATQRTALLTAMLAESVDYDAIRRQQVPVIAEAMDILNALQQANEFQQDFKRQQNAACRQATASGVPLQALSEVETAMFKVVDKEEFEILQLPRTPRRCVMIKEEVHEHTVPEETVTSQLAARHVPLVENWNEHVNYQHMRNYDLWILEKSLIDDQGVVFEGHGGVMPVDDMRQQFVAKTENNEHLNDRGHGSYAGGHKFSQLEDWAMDVYYHLAACCYGGDDMDQECIFVLHEFIDGEAQNWFCRHVLHTNWDKQDWTFKEVLIGLYNHFVNAVTMQEAREAFRTAVYDAQTGIQTFYDELMGHAQNMAVYLDEFTIRETFLDGIPAKMCRALICNDNLLLKVNTVTEFLVYAIRYKQSACTATHYDQRSLRHAQGHHQPIKVGTFLAKRSEMEQNCNPRFVVRHRLPAGQRSGPEPTGDASVAKKSRYMPRAGQPGPKGVWDGLPKVSHLKEELVDVEEVPPEVEEPEIDDDAESIHIDGDEYITVDVYDNEYYAHDDEEEHLFVLTEQHVTLQKAADKLQQPQYTPQEKECLVTYVKVNGHPAWTLWDSGSTIMGITPQFVHVNAIRVHELSEPLMLQLGTVRSCAMVQFGVEVKIKALGHLTKEYVNIVNFDCYDMIIGTPFMRKNKVTLDFVNNKVIVNRMLLKAERIVLADMNGQLQCH